MQANAEHGQHQNTRGLEEHPPQPHPLLSFEVVIFFLPQNHQKNVTCITIASVKIQRMRVQLLE